MLFYSHPKKKEWYPNYLPLLMMTLIIKVRICQFLLNLKLFLFQLYMLHSLKEYRYAQSVLKEWGILLFDLFKVQISGQILHGRFSFSSHVLIYSIFNWHHHELLYMYFTLQIVIKYCSHFPRCGPQKLFQLVFVSLWHILMMLVTFVNSNSLLSDTTRYSRIILFLSFWSCQNPWFL